MLIIKIKEFIQGDKMRKIPVKVRKKFPQKRILQVEFSDEVIEIPYEDTSSKKTSHFKQFLFRNKYRIQLFLSIIIAAIASFFFYLNIKKNIEQEKISKTLLNNYSLTTIYQNNTSNTKTSEPITYENPFVIGMMRISKINLNYPILSECSYELLKISLCRFNGPTPNQVGNMCIAGHNYVDNRFFSRLNELEKNDIIEIYDLFGEKIDYTVFDKYEVEPDDLSCTTQNTDGKKIITLVTCNNVNGKRLVIQAQE